MKNNVLFAFVILFTIGIAGCSQKSTSAFKPNSEPDGYAGIKWGTQFSEIKSSDMVESRNTIDLAEPDKKIKIFYTRKSDQLKLGEAALDKIEYVFWFGKFADVRIIASGSENFDKLKNYLFDKYGPVNKFQSAYTWDGKVTKIIFKYDESAKSVLLSIASTSLAAEEVKELYDRDK